MSEELISKKISWSARKTTRFTFLKEYPNNVKEMNNIIIKTNFFSQELKLWIVTLQFIQEDERSDRIVRKVINILKQLTGSYAAQWVRLSKLQHSKSILKNIKDHQYAIKVRK